VPKAVIFGLAGPGLDASEGRFFAAADPLGFILFARNCVDPGQVRALVADLRGAVGRADAPVLIDQEGGRVARLKPPHWRAAPPAAALGAIASRDVEQAKTAVKLNARLIAAELAALGIDVDCAPVLDVPAPGSHDIVGDRALSADPALVAELGRAAVEGFLEGGVVPVVKHIPGHGRATVDSHAELPVVDADRATLEASDFVPFRALADAPWAMTAHVVYTAIDAAAPATTSATVIGEVIRGAIGFKGVLVSDDLGMSALKGDFGARAAAALAAGCDIALHCSGAMREMEAVADAAGPLGDAAAARVARARSMVNMVKAAGPVDAAALSSQLQALMAEA
jgi:beta-N-acetylhexosaminidase